MPALTTAFLSLLALLVPAAASSVERAPTAVPASLSKTSLSAPSLSAVSRTAASETAPRDPAALDAAAPAALKALKAWMGYWLKGKILVFVNPNDPLGTNALDPGTLLKKFRLEPPGLLGKMTPTRELEILLSLCAEEDNEDAAEMLVRFAGAGLDGRNYTAGQAPHMVRAEALKAIAKLTSTEAKQFILNVANGEEKLGRRTEAMGNRAGAIEALGQLEDEAFRPAIESGLTSEEGAVRRAAAQGLAARPSDKSVRPLVDAMAKETDGATLMLLIASLRASMESSEEGISQIERRLAVEAAVAAIGQTGWRGDLALVEFLMRFRSAEAIPALITILESFQDAGDKIKSGELSTILQYAAHDALRSLTGTILPMDKPDQWRAFWEKNREGFEVPEAKDLDESETKGAFFGIPVKGSRIVFILDLSGSMEAPADMRGSEPIPGENNPTRWDQAKRQVEFAVERLPEVAFFNVVTFSGDSDQWQKNLQPADKRIKHAFIKWLDKINPGGGTNMWGGLERGLQMQGFAGEDRFDAPVDEIFLVSDGAPSLGQVVDPLEILQLVQESNRFAKIRINTIFIDSPLPRGVVMQTPEYTISPQEMMRRMAEENSGTFVQIGQPN